MSKKIKNAFSAFIIANGIFLTSFVAFPENTYAKTNLVDVAIGICSVPYETDMTELEVGLSNIQGPLSKPLVLVLPERQGGMNIRLSTSGGFGFTQSGFDAIINTEMYSKIIELISGAAKGLTVEGMDDVINAFNSFVKKAKIHVAMLDKNQNCIWSDSDAIKTSYNGGYRDFYCGAEVKFITVYSWYDIGMGETFKVKPLPVTVGYENAKLVQ